MRGWNIERIIINEGSIAKASPPLGLKPMTTFSGRSPLTALSIEDCAYRGEGNANVVIALPQERKVIRFRKSLPEEASPDDGKLSVEQEVEFAKNVVSWFFGSYAQIPEILRYDMKDIGRLSEAIRDLRPEKRRHKEITEVYATKFPDYTFLRTKLDDDLFRNKATFCVELKPKQGFLPKSEHKFQKCPYCLTQYYKLKKKVITARSSYCPFDLFSGLPERMKFALKELLKSPQNNLKIFKDGIVVYDQDSSWSDLERVLAEWFRNCTACPKEGYVDKFCDLICAGLLHPFGQEQSKPNASLAYNFLVPAQQDSKPRFCINQDVVAKAKKILYFAGEECNFESDGGLPNNSILERILRMQRLPFINREHIYNTYSKYSSVLTDEQVYFNLINSNRLCDYLVSPNAFEENPGSLTETYSRIYGKGSLISKRTKFSAGTNGNRHNNSEPLWLVNEAIENDSLVPNSTLVERHFDQNRKSYVQCNGENVDYNEKTDCFISIQDVFALQNYLIFSTARDCSILMSFRELNPTSAPFIHYEHIVKLSEDLSFLCNIGVSDLDPKSFHSIDKHRQRDTRVLTAVISILEEELAIKNKLSFDKRLSQ